MSERMSRRRFSPQTLTALVLALGTMAAQAANLKVEAKLIWATDMAKSPDENHKPVDPATAERLGKTFKWKHYFVVQSLVKDIPSRGLARFELSKKCTVEIKELEGPRVEVTLFGEGKPVHKTVKALNKGESFVYSGDDKNETAWFVIISDLDEKQ
jgi:hypothetical protein